MSEQEDFKKWCKDYFPNPIWLDAQCETELMDCFNGGYQACAKQKDKTIENIKLELATANKLHEDCASKFYDRDIENQALRAFAQAIESIDFTRFDDAVFAANFVRKTMKLHKLIDKTGNPTALLTGQTE